MTKKVTFSLFHRKFENGPFLPKMVQNWAKRPKMGVFRIFFENSALEFPNFLQEAQSLESKKNDGFGFSGKFQKWPFLTKIDPNLALISPFGLRNGLATFFFRQNFEKKLIFFFKNRKKIYFGRKKSTFCPSDPHYDLPLLTLRKFLKCLKRRFFAFFSRKKLKILSFIIILVEIWLVELKLKFVAFCHTQIGPFLSKNGQNYDIFGLK